MAVPFSQVKPDAVKLRVMPSFPGKFAVGPGLKVQQSGATVTHSIDFSGLAYGGELTPAEIASLYVAAWDNTAATFRLYLASGLRGPQGIPGEQGTPGDSVNFNTIAQAQAATIAVTAKAIRTAGYTTIGIGGGLYSRVALMPTHQGRFRSADRFMPDGSTDATNGGWWELDTVSPTAFQFGADGAGGATDTTAQTNMLAYSQAKFVAVTPGPIRSAFQVSVGIDHIDGRTFVNCDGTDETARIQAMFAAAKNKRLSLPPGMKGASTPSVPLISLDPDAHWWVQGIGAFPNGSGNTIQDIGTGKTIVYDNSALAAQADKSCILENFGVLSNYSASDGFWARYGTNIKIRGLWISGCGGNGINMERCFGSSIKDHTYVTRCGLNGIRLYSQINSFVLENVRSIGNSCITGNANLLIGAENTANANHKIVIAGSCDLSYAGTNKIGGGIVAEAYGATFAFCEGLELNGMYVEQVSPGPATTYLAAYLANCKSVVMQGAYVLDGKVQFADGSVLDAFVGVNRFERQLLPTGITMNAASGDNIRYMNQSLVGGATQTFSGAGATII